MKFCRLEFRLSSTNKDYRLIKTVLCFIWLVTPTHGWPSYRLSIPNGQNVPNPCEPNSIWNAVGHSNPTVFAPRNPFGEDFLRYGMTWNKRLCMTDSDGDGKTNGEELGDPTCEWQKSTPTPLLPSVSHPGICEPTESIQCQQINHYQCPGPKKFECPAFKRNDTLVLNVTMTRTHVPIKPSSYVCLEVRLPYDKDYHLLAAKPVIDQPKIVDQIQIFACDSGLHSRVYNHPFECGEKPRGDCQSIIGGFSSKDPGICFPRNAGYKMGLSGTRQVIFQIRYTNPLLNQALYDSSGILFYYTNNLQPFDMGTKLLSITHFTIPPGSRQTTITAEYPQQCSAIQMSKPIFITGAFIHMHKYGRKQRVELIRNGAVREIFAEGNDFRAHHLNGNHLENPIQVYPGDSIRIACWYDTRSALTPITWGLLSTNEMCSASLLFYPKSNWLQATGTSFKTIPLCKLQTTGEVNGCKFGRLFDAVRQQDETTVALAYCAEEKICTPKCLSISSIAFTHPCLNGENYELLQSRLTRKFTNLKNFMDTLHLCGVKEAINYTTYQTTSAPTIVPEIPKVFPQTFPLIVGSQPETNLPSDLANGIPMGPPPTITSQSHVGHMRPIEKPIEKVMPTPNIESYMQNVQLSQPTLPSISEKIPASNPQNNSPSNTQSSFPAFYPQNNSPSNTQSSLFEGAQDPLLVKLAEIMKLIQSTSHTPSV